MKNGARNSAYGIAIREHKGNLSGPASGCVFVPVAENITGMDAIVEALRLADIAPVGRKPT